MPKRFRRPIKLIISLSVIAVGSGAFFLVRFFSFESRFARSLPAMEQYAATVAASDLSKPIPVVPPRLGAFKTTDAERLPHGFLFFADYGHPLDANGIAYSTEPLPDEIAGDYFESIGGRWYTFLRNGIPEPTSKPSTQTPTMVDPANFPSPH